MSMKNEIVIDDGGTAFPTKGKAFEMPGMTLRDWFAGQSLAGVISDLMANNEAYSNEDIAKGCYEVADAMIKERNRTGG